MRYSKRKGGVANEAGNPVIFIESDFLGSFIVKVDLVPSIQVTAMTEWFEQELPFTGALMVPCPQARHVDRIAVREPAEAKRRQVGVEDAERPEPRTVKLCTDIQADVQAEAATGVGPLRRLRGSYRLREMRRRRPSGNYSQRIP